MIESERYCVVPSIDPIFSFQVWDWEENVAICLCDKKENADWIAKAYNISKKFNQNQEDEASPEVRDKIVSLIKEGKVELSDLAQEAFSTINPGKADFTVTRVELGCFWGPYEKNQGGIELQWGTKSAGFGMLSLCVDNDGKLKCNNEGMDKKFVVEVFEKFIDQADFTGH